MRKTLLSPAYCTPTLDSFRLDCLRFERLDKVGNGRLVRERESAATPVPKGVEEGEVETMKAE